MAIFFPVNYVKLKKKWEVDLFQHPSNQHLFDLFGKKSKRSFTKKEKGKFLGKLSFPKDTILKVVEMHFFGDDHNHRRSHIIIKLAENQKKINPRFLNCNILVSFNQLYNLEYKTLNFMEASESLRECIF